MPEPESKRKKHTPKQLRVVFDTSALFTGSASNLVKTDLAALIHRSVYPDLKILWYLPNVVRHERQYQMQTKALELIPSIHKMERLLGHELNITEALVKGQVESAVLRNLEELGLEELKLDHAKVDLNRLMLDSAYRRLPFQPGEKEKGFRDALVLETFAQLVEESPKSIQVCRLVLVSSDGLMKQTADIRFADIPNVRVLATIEELTGLINTLISDVDEAFVALLRPKASNLFFSSSDAKGALLYKANVMARIEKQYAKELSEKPEGADARTNTTWTVNHPNFIKKEGQRMFWLTKIEIESTATRSIEPAPIYASGIMQGATLPTDYTYSSTPLKDASERWEGWFEPATPTKFARYSSPYSTYPLRTEVTHKGIDTYEVVWSIEVTMAKNLRKPKVEEVRHAGLVWQPV